MSFLVGTSGYSYRHWSHGVFYPEGVPQARWLGYYAGHFTTVELNVTFYRLPREKSFRRWYDATPPGFRFSLKGSRLITHQKRLLDCGDLVESFISRARTLGEKFLGILWQLPPGFAKDTARLEEFCETLSMTDTENRLHAFEFRHPSWFCVKTFSALHRYGYSCCLAHSGKFPGPGITPQPFYYLRFHGAEDLYASRYTDDFLRSWADRIVGWQREGKDVLAYFNNDYRGHAVENARSLGAMITRR